LALGDTDSTQPFSPPSVPDFTSSAVSLVFSVPSSYSLDSFLVNSASPLVYSAPISSHSVALVYVLATDVIEKSQDMESSSAPMAFLPSGFPAAVPGTSYRRRTGEHFEAILDKPGHTSSGCDNGEQLSFSSTTVVQRVVDKNGEQSSSTNREQSISTERILSVVMSTRAACNSSKSSKMAFATQQFPVLRL
jgi:hypothetical protein